MDDLRIPCVLWFPGDPLTCHWFVISDDQTQRCDISNTPARGTLTWRSRPACCFQVHVVGRGVR
jgi:hypothetical protein